MKRLVQYGIGALALAALAFSGTQAQAAKCKKYSAMGVGVTQELAKGLAKVNLDFEEGFANAKGKGPTKYTCKGQVLAECRATQVACK